MSRKLIFVHNGNRIPTDEWEAYLKTYRVEVACTKPKSTKTSADTIDEVLAALQNTIFYYEILTDQKVCAEATEDALHRHYLNDFGGYATNGYEIIQLKNKQYLLIWIYIHPDIEYLEEDTELIATPKNIKKCFDDINLPLKNGKFILPKEFEDSIYPEDPKGEDKYIDSVNATFKFYKMRYNDDAPHKNVDLTNYIEFK